MAYSPIVTGLWTPNLQINSSSTGITYTIQAGGYTQIGNTVNIWGQITLSNKGASTGSVTISNLPIATKANGVRNTLLINNYDAVTSAGGYTTLSLQLAASSTIAQLIFSSASGAGVVGASQANLTNTTMLMFSGIYILD